MGVTLEPGWQTGVPIVGGVNDLARGLAYSVAVNG
jgi:hypothetical protein